MEDNDEILDDASEKFGSEEGSGEDLLDNMEQ